MTGTITNYIKLDNTNEDNIYKIVIDGKKVKLTYNKVNNNKIIFTFKRDIYYKIKTIIYYYIKYIIGLSNDNNQNIDKILNSNFYISYVDLEIKLYNALNNIHKYIKEYNKKIKHIKQCNLDNFNYYIGNYTITQINKNTNDVEIHPEYFKYINKIKKYNDDSIPYIPYNKQCEFIKITKNYDDIKEYKRKLVNIMKEILSN